jgi:hypothetical protein
MRRYGYGYILVPSAKTLHDIPLRKKTVMEHIDRQRAFYHLRNRTILSTYFGFAGFIGFVIAILPELFVFYVINCMKSHRRDLIRPMLNGLFNGLQLSFVRITGNRKIGVNYLHGIERNDY